jgi:hypothetical protein
MAAGLSSQPFYWEQEDYDSSILIIKSRDKLWTKHDKAIWIAAIPVRSLTAWNEYVFFFWSWLMSQSVSCHCEMGFERGESWLFFMIQSLGSSSVIILIWRYFSP